MTSEKRIQALRTMDKLDKIGCTGVVDLLQKPVEEFGAGLDPIQAGLIGLFLSTPGETNEKTLDKIEKVLSHAQEVRSRLDIMALLESQILDADGATAWDHFLTMRENDDETWRNGGRPKNIAWALDDLIARLRKALPAPAKRQSA